MQPKGKSCQRVWQGETQRDSHFRNPLWMEKKWTRNDGANVRKQLTWWWLALFGWWGICALVPTSLRRNHYRHRVGSYGVPSSERQDWARHIALLATKKSDVVFESTSAAIPSGKIVLFLFVNSNPYIRLGKGWRCRWDMMISSNRLLVKFLVHPLAFQL